MSKVNVGVVGVGAMGYNHVRVYSELENANLMAVSILCRERWQKYQKSLTLLDLWTMTTY